MLSGFVLNNQQASIISRPLFIIVAESTDILRPILQFGCAHASSGVTFSNSFNALVRNGPPEPVSNIFVIPDSAKPLS